MIENVLFRGKSIYTGDWLEGYYAACGNDTYIITVIPVDPAFPQTSGGMPQLANNPVIPETVGRYSGRKDIYGVKIFQGDLTESTYSGEIIEIKYGRYMSWCTEDENTECEAVGFYASAEGRQDMPLGATEDWAAVVGNKSDSGINRQKSLVQQYIDNEKAYSARWWSTKKELPAGETLECRKKQSELIEKMSIGDLEELIIRLTNNKQAKIYYAEQIDIKKGGDNPDLK